MAKAWLSLLWVINKGNRTFSQDIAFTKKRNVLFHLDSLFSKEPKTKTRFYCVHSCYFERPIETESELGNYCARRLSGAQVMLTLLEREHSEIILCPFWITSSACIC